MEHTKAQNLDIEIQNVFQLQKRKALQIKKNPISSRLDLLKSLQNEILNSENEIIEAHDKDFRKPALEVLMTEILPVISEIKLIQKHLKNWSRPKCATFNLHLLGSKNEIHSEPKGVVLIISPWNYPFSLALVPVVSALAAGNTVILKPSELTPHVSSLLKKLITSVFPKDLVHVLEGGRELSEKLLDLPVDHIFFTGSTSVGRSVMSRAAQNITPITLELGGKSPTILDKTCQIQLAAQKIVWGKILNSGQTCVAPDYVCIPKDLKADFKYHLKSEFQKMNPDSLQRSQIINEKNTDRLNQYLTEDSSLEIEYLEDKNLSSTRQIPLQFIFLDMKKDAHLKLLNEEIFGPLLPILCYDSEHELLNHLQRQERPLAMYLFSEDSKFINRILSQTYSGGVCVNDLILHVGHHGLPFGGIGKSGFGNYHGEAGFRTFSHERAIMKQGWGRYLISFFYPPYTHFKLKVLRYLIRSRF